MVLLCKGGEVKTYTREITECKMAEQRGILRTQEETNGEYEEEGVIVSVTLRYVLLAPSLLILCLLTPRVIYEPL